MTALSLPDLTALAWFLGAWTAYSIVIERSAKGRTSLNALMNSYRDEWMERLLARDMRMVDAQVTAALQMARLCVHQLDRCRRRADAAALKR
jgi:uncharacterized membrane protein